MRKRSNTLIIFLVAAAMAEEKPANVDGLVTHALTGAPILRAHVTCDGFVANKQQLFGAMTNAEGKFSIQGLPAGTYTCDAQRVGFVAPVENGRRGVPPLTLRPDTTAEAKFKLTPTGAILGRVVDSEGNAVDGAGVYAEGTSGNRTAASMTDHKGQYRIGGLTPGRYRIRAAPPNFPFPPEARTDGSEEIHHVATYHPGGLERKSGTRLDVRSGADLTGIDVKLVRAPRVRVSGIVTGIPAGARVWVESRTNGTQGPTASVATDGKFEIWNLEPGKWRIAAMGARPELGRSAALEIEVGTQHLDGIELRMMPPFVVSGQAVFDDDSAKPRQQAPGGPPPRMSLQDVDRLGGIRGTKPAVLSEDGTFRFDDVTPGQYRVNIGWRASIKSVRIGPVEMENQVLDLRAGAAGPVTVVFGPATTQVSGTVRDDQGPVAGALVVLRNTGIGIGSTNAAYRSVTHADGTYLFGNVPSGRYVLLAMDADETNPISDTYEDYDDVLVELTVGSGEKLHRDLKRHSASR